MTQTTNTSPKLGNYWERPATRPDPNLANRTDEDITEWNILVEEVIQIATENNWSKAEVSRRINMPDSTFSGWFSGTYNGKLDNQNLKIRQWINALKDNAALGSSIPEKPPFQKTKMANEIINTLALAQATGDFVLIEIAAGIGKTETCRYYRSTRPHTYLVTASPHTKTVHGILVDLASELEVLEYNPAKLTRAIGRKLERVGSGTLLIIDEAQNLTDEAINQLRHFVDVYGTGLALVGNEEVYGRLTRKQDGPSYAQLKSRIGKRLKRNKPYKEDISARINAWSVSEPDAVKYLTGIGLKAGALRQIDKTMILAGITAFGENTAVSLEHIKAAWTNRDLEDLA